MANSTKAATKVAAGNREPFGLNWSRAKFGRDFRIISWNTPAIMKILATFCALNLALGFALAQTGEPKKEDTKKDAAPAATNEVAVIKTSAGDMVIEFWPDAAPKTVENFKTLARKGFYDGTAFHRIVKGFMIQGGDPFTKDLAKEALWGQGDPGYKIKAEFNDHSHQRGVISMARSQHPDSAGSQFFICLGDASFLDHKYTAFGKLIKGDDVLEKIANTPVTSSGSGERSKPTTRIEVKGIKLVPADSVK
jgi:peptidyl-prolyl cis-trans isomerase B (cyclophilin B)